MNHTMTLSAVNLHRLGRTVYATGPGRAGLHPGARAWLADALTYFEKKFDYTTGEGGIELIERHLYTVHPQTGEVVFPLGLRPRVAAGLRRAGFVVTGTGGTLAAAPPPGRPDAWGLDWDGLFNEFEVYPDQADCLAKIIAADGGVVSAMTGWGKSMLIRMICRLFHKARIHVTTKAATLMDEIYTDLVGVVPGVARVGGRAGRTRRPARVTVFTADSLHHGGGDCDLLLADEVHELCAPKYTQKLGMYTAARMFAFSASPTGRMDGRDVVGEAIFGPILHTMDYQAAQAAGRVVPITVEWLRVDRGPDLTGVGNPTERDRFGIWQNAHRNAVIAARAAAFPPDQQTLIMVKTIDHAVRLKALLPDYTLAYAANGMDDRRLAAYIREGLLPADEPAMTTDRLNDLRRRFAANDLRKVIANYVWSTGVNFRYLSALIRADAAGSEIRDTQIPGRACRRVAGVKESAVLVDCFDAWDPRYEEKARGRRRNYEKKGWVQVWADPVVARQEVLL